MNTCHTSFDLIVYLRNDAPKLSEKEQRKFIIFEQQLLELFRSCRACAAPIVGYITTLDGNLIQVVQKCKKCSFIHTLYSQPYIHQLPAGNMLMSCSILMCGAVPSQVPIIGISQIIVSLLLRISGLTHTTKFLMNLERLEGPC